MNRDFDTTRLYADIQDRDDTITRLQEELAWERHEKELLEEQVDLLRIELEKYDAKPISI